MVPIWGKRRPLSEVQIRHASNFKFPVLRVLLATHLIWSRLNSEVICLCIFLSHVVFHVSALVNVLDALCLIWFWGIHNIQIQCSHFLSLHYLIYHLILQNYIITRIWRAALHEERPLTLPDITKQQNRLSENTFMGNNLPRGHRSSQQRCMFRLILCYACS